MDILKTNQKCYWLTLFLFVLERICNSFLLNYKKVDYEILLPFLIPIVDILICIESAFHYYS